MPDNTVILREYATGTPVLRAVSSNDQTILRDYATNQPLYRLDGDIGGGGVEVMTREQRLAITPAAGDLIYDTTDRSLYVGDGVTPGGVAVSGGAIPSILSLGDWTDEMEDVYTPGDGNWTR